MHIKYQNLQMMTQGVSSRMWKSIFNQLLIALFNLFGPMTSKKDEFTGKVLNYFGLGEVHPIYVAVPVGIVTGVVTLTIYRYYMGSSRKPDTKRIQVERQLSQALEAVKDLEGKLYNMEQQDLKQKNEEGRPIRIFMDGAFDMMHYGHMNAFRQGRALGTHLVVGVNSDESIKVCKGPPVCGEKERLATVRGCKWVDEVVENVPYVMSDEYLRWVIEKYNIDYVVHGDDPCIVDGRDCYEGAVKLGKYLTIPRTEGISTTDIVGRMLLMTRDHHTASSAAKAVNDESVPGTPNGGSSRSGSFGGSANEVASTPAGNYKLASSEKNNAPLDEEGEVVRPLPFIRHSRFLTTSRTIRLFGAGVTVPKPSDRVVYLAGAWDMFHAGHIEILEKARKLGDYVIVGVHNDSIVNQRRGMNLPIMNLHERVLSVLGCKWVDDVLIDAPYIITEEMIQSLNISIVVTGAVETKRKFRSDSSDGSDSDGRDYKSAATNADGTPKLPESEKEAYRVPKEMGILTVLPCSDLDSGGVLGFVQRIQNQRKRFTEKYQTKAKTETQYYTDKYKK